MLANIQVQIFLVIISSLFKCGKYNVLSKINFLRQNIVGVYRRGVYFKVTGDSDVCFRSSDGRNTRTKYNLLNMYMCIYI